MNNIPIYKAQINESDEGITAISFVREPAVETCFLQFAKQAQLNFSILDNKHKKIIAPVMRCDFPIYRNDKQMGEYYIVYDKETIEIMARKLLADKATDNLNKEHNPREVMKGVYLEELFIKNVEKGINPIGFEEVENYSLFAVYAIEDFEVWNNIENGQFNGISLEGMFTIEEFEEDEELNDLIEILSLLQECYKRGIK